MRTTLLTIAAFAAASPAAAATTVFTEDFNGVKPQTYGAGQNVGQFKLTAGDADVVGDLNGLFFGCGTNNNCVDMNGNSPGTFSAMLDVIQGNTYHVTFDIAGNGARPSGLYSIAAGLGNSPYYQFNLEPGAPWQTVSFDYVAAWTGAAELGLQSLNTDTPGYWGMLLDNVKVENLSATGAVPEPASWALMLFGFGAMGGMLRSRRHAPRIRFA